MELFCLVRAHAVHQQSVPSSAKLRSVEFEFSLAVSVSCLKAIASRANSARTPIHSPHSICSPQSATYMQISPGLTHPIADVNPTPAYSGRKSKVIHFIHQQYANGSAPYWRVVSLSRDHRQHLTRKKGRQLCH